MKSLLLTIIVCAACILSSGTTALAYVETQSVNGATVVYDAMNDLFWYPRLTDTLNMTRAQQEQFIAGLNARCYARIDGWKMATSQQTQALKDCLASMGSRVQHEWPWTPDGAPRNWASPWLSFPVRVDEFFTPTSVMTQPLPMIPMLILDGHTMQIFNGRTTGAWWRSDVPAMPYTWQYGEADDHFVTSAYRTPDEFATMTFNYDVHYLPDDATTREFFPGPMGAWIVSETGPTYRAQVMMVPSLIVRNYLHLPAYSTIFCQISFLENYHVSEIDPCTLCLAGTALPIDYQCTGNLLQAWFATADIVHLLQPGLVELTVTGRLKNGFRCEGTYNIRVW